VPQGKEKASKEKRMKHNSARAAVADLGRKIKDKMKGSASELAEEDE
jgi:hypothetical protein